MNRKWALVLLVAALVLGAGARGVEADSTATQTVVIDVQAINEIAVSGDPPKLVVSTATAGRQPDPAIDRSTRYAITTNESGKKITAEIDGVEGLPEGVTLKLYLEPPTGATSAEKVLTIEATDVVTGISRVAEGNLTIRYTLEATVTAGPLTASRTITLTIAPDN